MFKLGKHPKRHVPYQLKLANYALASMPAPPAAANWGDEGEVDAESTEPQEVPAVPDDK